MIATHSRFAAMSRRIKQVIVLSGMLAAGAPFAAAAPPPPQPGVATAPADGVIRVRSAYGFGETVNRIEAAVRANKIRFFGEIDQANLAATAHISLRPSKLLLFGNPPLGIQLLTANPLAGLDWPVRMLVTQDADGQVWMAYTDFEFIAHRYGIADRPAVVAMATKVSALIAGSAAAP